LGQRQEADTYSLFKYDRSIHFFRSLKSVFPFHLSLIQ
jgi:hypothetical protein